MKKLKIKLTRKITDIISCAVLWCEGKGHFKHYGNYRFPLTDEFYVDIVKEQLGFSYRVELIRRGALVIYASIDYDVFRKDVPIQKAYTLKEIVIPSDNIKSLEDLLYELSQ